MGKSDFEPGARGVEQPHGPSRAPSSSDPAHEMLTPQKGLLGQAPPSGAGNQVGSEQELWQGRTHPAHYAGRFFLWLAGNIAAGVLIISGAKRWESITWIHGLLAILVVLTVSFILVLGKVIVQILSQRFRLTSERLFVHNGILSQTIDQTELIRVDDVRLFKTVVDRLFDLGTIVVVTTDATNRELKIEGIAGPERVAEAMRDRIRSLRSKSLYVENL